MSAAAPPPAVPPATAADIDPKDPLGYHAYAKTLWTRIDHALNRDDANTKLGDDPLVVGLFGEWGVGKSHLLMQIRQLADANLVEQKKLRESDPGDTLTIPVWFQAWKYEHEDFMHVPLVLHVMNALKDALHEPPSIAGTVLDAGGKAVAVAEKAAKPVARIAKIASSIFPVVQKILGSVSVFGCKIDVPDEVGDWLESAAEAATSAAEKDKDKKHKGPKELVATGSKDGLYFYRINELLEALTRPGKYEGRKELIAHANITHETRINFVVFVDDLDRCLPEKAVQVLELIKTVFNVESFAFVLALDDEVIERGIGHRYKDYTFENKKQQMPITGFEYLEKIVHLPFRLPALTEKQAIAFVRTVEKRVDPEGTPLQPHKPLHWFAELGAGSPIAYRERNDEPGLTSMPGATDDRNPLDKGSTGGRAKSPTAPPIEPHSAHLRLLLASFDAYVPRKLLRTVELWHQLCNVAREREVASESSVELFWSRASDGNRVALDTRVIFALMLLQLFQPDLFRFMRRRSSAFPILLGAFRRKDPSVLLSDGLHKTQLSDVDLWSWASFYAAEAAPANGKKSSKRPVKRPTNEAAAVALISALPTDKTGEEDRPYQAQQIRLRLVEKLVEHGAAQRHVFNPFKLMHALSIALPLDKDGTFSCVKDIQVYFAVLSQHSQADIDALGMPSRVATEMARDTATIHDEATGSIGERVVGASGETSTIALATPTFALSDPEGLFNILIAADTAARSGIQERHSLRAKQIINPRGVAELSYRFLSYVTERTTSGKPINESDFLHITGALAAIAPWLGWLEGGRNIFATLGGAADKDGAQTAHALIDEILAAAPTPKCRAAIGDLLERFADGDPRFDPRHPHSLCDRFPANARNLSDEPIPGFVRIPAGSFTMGHASEVNDEGKSNNKPRPVNIDEDFYIARTLTTVGQYARFIDSGAYSDASAKFWGAAGLKWLDIGTNVGKSAPEGWAEQRAHANRPVVGICWFEARAYARWLSTIMATELAAVSTDPTFQVRLPTEAQWERAARAKSASEWHEKRWPFGDDPNSVPKNANVNGSDIGSVSAVGVFPPNPIGLYDMAGNAWEWMDNVYESNSPKTFARVGADDKSSGSLSLRGGSWIGHPEGAGCSYRSWDLPDYSYDDMGVRVVLSLAQNEP